ncbi:unnamed protein product [Chironomus riparius]|uniref:Uncharacterized protein n=1 Tax=Chironomus riparius TaxID=315576 RepID=A0A9N9RJP6_9DIPT|nr:unnamed protein product [Chironomus riparius]
MSIQRKYFIVVLQGCNANFQCHVILNNLIAKSK